MNRLFHISDTHLSFNAQGTILKPLDQRSWSRGSPNYVDYLNKIKAFAANVITPSDFTCVTGDVVHDMKLSLVSHSLRWLENTIPGTIIVIRGNHDQYWTAAKLRRVYASTRLFLLDEGEILTVGPYTFGCYSDHSTKSDSASMTYVDVAYRTAEQAKRVNTTPILLSHYPLDVKTAEMVGDAGIRAYLSGHVHVTRGDAPEGTSWDWYNTKAIFTDDKIINNCYFSTGTTDVVLKKHGEFFKHIDYVDVDDLLNRQSTKTKRRAAHLFNCSEKFVTPFERKDPFNPSNVVTGWLCRKEGMLHGSLLIVKVNDIDVEPQLIYGTPKLAYPYKDRSTEYIDFPTYAHYYLADKWNGMNVLVYKYLDQQGKEFITAKSKGTPFIADSEHGKFFTLTVAALRPHSLDDLPDFLMPINEDSIQSVSLELCGKLEPHLVSYDFDIALKPLFKTYQTGEIAPLYINDTRSFGPLPTTDSLAKTCSAFQQEDLNLNEAFREAGGLKHRYEYNHFAAEGRVLYLLSHEGKVINRTLYKIKPSDIEEVHWQNFDDSMQQRVKEAIIKIKSAELSVTPELLRVELDMGPKEWDKWKRQVEKFVESPKVDRSVSKMQILVGIPGSGKSTYAIELETQGWVIVCQDDLGSRNACKKVVDNALRDGKNVIVDRCNFDANQRKPWIDLARKYGVADVSAIVFDVSQDECEARVMNRSSHKTLPPDSSVHSTLNRFVRMMHLPDKAEGFSEIVTRTYDKSLGRHVPDRS